MNPTDLETGLLRFVILLFSNVISKHFKMRNLNNRFSTTENSSVKLVFTFKVPKDTGKTIKEAKVA